MTLTQRRLTGAPSYRESIHCRGRLVSIASDEASVFRRQRMRQLELFVRPELFVSQ